MLTARYPTKSARTEDQNCLAPPSETIRQPSAYIRMKNVHLSSYYGLWHSSCRSMLDAVAGPEYTNLYAGAPTNNPSRVHIP